ncbi:GNAT family N-acetyltransferase [Phyllobacterium phragmitis]|uniref:GNAT family N-acetyltransferase n=1 Tax=Phyllobacterium phragmitis TaxID=2670329 RepID=A0A2S9IR93_9HYPH|nr:GNAT family N-acetyltransferase [Phyllobacterium phragmitis]PRD43041.1 GNAT family N-acetyltransferase [Phyllobacterium phragmitis]
MARLSPPRQLIEEDNRQAFDCGRDSMNEWFRRHAWRNQQLGVSRSTVICDAQTGEIAGYVTLAMGHIEREYLPKASQRNRPENIPIFLLGQLAVDRRFQKTGVARSLLFYALKTSVRVAKEVGCVGVLTHPLDDEVRAFYRRFGFEDLPYDRRRSMMVRIKDLERNGFGED